MTDGRVAMRRGATATTDGRPRWLRVAQAAWLALLGALLALVLLGNADAVADLARVDRPLLLIAALACTFLQLALNAAFWVRALAAAGERVAWRTALQVTARSLPARYVPGSVWYAMSRAALLRAGGTGLGALAVAAALESLLSVVVSLGMGGTLLGLARRVPGEELAGVAWVALLAVAVAPPVLNRLLAWLARRRGAVAPELSWRDLTVLIALMAAFWAVSAAAFTLYLAAFPVALPAPAAVAGAFLVAWAIGFLTPIAPQGAGAFEITFVAVLGGAGGAPLVVLVAAFRAVVGVRDAVAFTWGAWRGRGAATARVSRPSSPASSPEEQPARR
jgi:uncharacterized membrane protein YbhN (UPF0104 family)